MVRTTLPQSEPAATRPIYLDYQATTPTDPRVVEAMLPYFSERFGNPHSIHHRLGEEAAAAVETARGQTAALIGAEPREIVFTSGATESNNLAIKGAARFHKARRPHLVTLVTEHKCVLESCRRMESEGVEVTYLPVKGNGLVDLDRLRAAVTERTALVSIMAVNNEIGVIQPLAEIGAICRENGAYFHCDAAQAAGKIPLDVEAMSIDLMSISGHKLYGPKGIGVLYVRRRPRVRLEPLIDGGGQERGLRSGTLAAPLCVGLGVACAIAAEEMTAEGARLAALRRKLLDGLCARLDRLHVNGDPVQHIPGNLNVSFDGVGAETLMAALPGLAMATGSACTSASVEPSYVLRALGLPDARAASSLRIGLGRFTTEEEIDIAVERIAAAVKKLRGSGSRAAE
ncbi:MAG: IscS subfamily cysteine desulfurase [Rhodospirillales bacterium]|nr:IscS subfamily cysteine desulfurase [Rhodospirillales bacterium]